MCRDLENVLLQFNYTKPHGHIFMIHLYTISKLLNLSHQRSYVCCVLQCKVPVEYPLTHIHPAHV